MPYATPSQTIGPYWHLLLEPSWTDLTRFGATGEVISLEGRITDGAGALVTDACVEIWQTSPPASETFDGFGRSRTDSNGEFHFTTIRPAPTPGLGNAQQAPHLALTILARGVTKALMTRVYFDGDAGHDTDPVLSLIDDPARRATLVAHNTAGNTWRLDIHLQGAHETVFMDV
jgi:protocatechuate 3,4-dioxygenase alpha subunit